MLKKLLIVLLLEGFISISIEILTIRQLIPFYGGSVIITSIIIGIFLLFLALGYWRGGSYQPRYFLQLRRNFLLSLIWIGLGLSYTFISLFYYVGILYLHIPFILTLFLFLLAVLAPVVYWLGQTVPLTTNLFNQQHGVSRISGHVLFLSTIGSFLGALVTSLLLFQFLGVAWTVVINCGLLFFLICILRQPDEPAAFSYQILGAFIAFIFSYLLNLHIEHSQFKKTNNYANYQVHQLANFTKILNINHSASSQLTYDQKGFPYIEFIRNILFTQLNLQHKKILVIGAGGFTFTAAGTNENEITYVDIDPDLKKIAEQEFLARPINGKFIGQDGRRFLQQSKEQFDVIISDVYSNQATIPPSLLTQEYFQAIFQHLKINGLFIGNIIAAPFFNDDYSKKVFSTIHSVFPYCLIQALRYGTVANVIYICPKTESNYDRYTDDWNTSTLDFFYTQSKQNF